MNHGPNIDNLETLYFYSKFLDKIPNVPGNYFWYYWPPIDDEFKNWDRNKLKLFLEDYSQKSLFYELECTDRYKKFKVKVQEVEFSATLGLSSSLLEKLLDYIFQSEQNFKFFIDFFRSICLCKPIYIGKALRLRDRLKQHFEQRNSDIIRKIDSDKIPSYNIHIAFTTLDLDFEEDITSIFETVWQSKLRPGLVKKNG
jgi:hypothetical protein